MNRLLAATVLTAMLLSLPASAFWGWDDDNGYSSGDYNGAGDFTGDADAEGEATFTMTFTGRGKTRGNFRGNADTDTDWYGYGYDSPYWYGAPYYYGAPYWGPYAQPAPAPMTTPEAGGANSQ